MLTVSTPPKTPTLTKENGGNRKYHTIHFNGHVFTIQKNGTAVLSFRKKEDANKFSKIIESHFDLTYSWPVIDFEQPVFYAQSSKTSRLKYVNVKMWNEDRLRDFCIINCFSMLDIHKFEDDNVLVGNSVFWEASPDFYANIFNERLTIE